MYPEEIVTPCRRELAEIGVEELRTSQEVENELGNQTGTMLMVINSVCGCAAGSARPALRLAFEHSVKPDRATSVFAGVDNDATEKARSYMAGFPPSSPSMALFKNGQLVFMMERRMIEGRDPRDIAAVLQKAFDLHCNKSE